MPDSVQFRETMRRYLKARIPFISIRSIERQRVLDALTELAEEIGIAVYAHTLSQGMKDLRTNKTVNEDRSIIGGLDWAAQQASSRQNVTFVFTEVSDIEDDNQISRQFFDTVIMAIERGGSIVVVTPRSIWPQLQRMGMSLTLDPPNEDEMLSIVRDSIVPYRGQLTIEWGEEEFHHAASILANMTKVEAENILATFLAKGSVLNEDLIELGQAKDRLFSDISGVEKVKVREADIPVGGLEGLRKWLDKQRVLLTADLRSRKLRPPRGVLLVGVPGCGKSLSAKFIAASWGLSLYRLDLASIHGQYLGQSENRLKEALATADYMAPCVLWIDEIEKGLAGATSSSDGGTSTRMVGQFLFWLQESTARVFVVATANDVSRLPPELLRRGRFDELFFVDLPTEAERQDIIQLYIVRNRVKNPSPATMAKLIDMSDGFAGADLEAAVREVALIAVLEGDAAVTDATYVDSFANVVPLIKTSPERIEEIRGWGRERAVPASGIAIGSVGAQKGSQRRVLVFGDGSAHP